MCPKIATHDWSTLYRSPDFIGNWFVAMGVAASKPGGPSSRHLDETGIQQCRHVLPFLIEWPFIKT
jgi:hypothetical protein